MAAFVVKADASSMLKALNELPAKQLAYANARALNMCAAAISKKLTADMDAVFDKPTPFTKSAVVAKFAKKTDDPMISFVEVKDKQRKYLIAEIEGGPRKPKGFENLLIKAGLLPAGWFAIPASGALIDQYGNVPASIMTRILSQVQASRDSQQNESRLIRKKRDRKLDQGRYFVIKVGDVAWFRPGIYERLTSASHGPIKPIFIFSAKAPIYRKRWDFYGTAQEMAAKLFPEEFEKAVAYAIATQR